MVTNVEVTAVDNTVVVYLQDGTTGTIEPGQGKGFQLIDGGFVTVSDVVSAEEGEHPDQTLPGAPPKPTQLPAPEDHIPDFAKKMLAWWKDFFDALKTKPTATPTKPTAMPADKKK